MSTVRMDGRKPWWRALAAVSALATTAGLAALTAPVAQAETVAAVADPSSSTVSADVLPTVQVNGVVWDQVVVGDRVYATGKFTSARPAGAASGTKETARGNLLAFDLRTGELVTSWAPSLNAQGLVITASADGRRIYVGGDFTSAGGAARSRVAAFDATSGALVTTFAANTNGRVRGLAVSGDTLFVGGDFSTLGGQARTRLGAVATSNGAVRPWAPAADREVMALVAPAGSGQVVVGGRFETLNGETNRGMGALDASTGAVLPWAANRTIQNYGPDSAIWSLSTDGTQVYGTGYDFYGPSDFENSFAASLAGGSLQWVNGCLGDTYSSQPVGGVLYTVGHAHNCTSMGGHPQTSPETYQRAIATTTTATGRVRSGAFSGQPAPSLLHWLPTVAQGTYTGQYQGAWDITGDSRYVVMAGEFPRVNGVAQQGLARFAVRSAAPGKDGPQGYTELKPVLTALAPGALRVSWTSAWDRDDATLTYELLRGTNASTAKVVGSRTASTSWWSRPAMAITDTESPAGSTQTYRVRVTDGTGNVVTSAATAGTVPQGSVPSNVYLDTVRADGATAYWRLGEADGSTSYDWVGADDLTLGSSATRGVGGAVAGDAATRFTGRDAVPATSTSSLEAPATFSVESWVRTSSTQGGKVVGFGSSSTGTSGSYDRHVYLDGSGRITFGVHPGSVRALTSRAGYNDGQWHQVVATLGPEGQTLYIDGRRVARDAATTTGQDYSGFWRVGGDNVNGWPSTGAGALAGDIDDVAVYGDVLTAAQVADHYAKSGRTSAGGPRPSDAYGTAVYDADPDFFWRLEEASGTSAKDTSLSAQDGQLSGGVRQGVAGVVGTGAELDGSDDLVSSVTQVPGPSSYSEELWFSTTTARGGKIIGFGDAATGRSGSYDRHVYMLDDGRLRFGVWNGRTDVVDSRAPYNDGRWHHLVATQGAQGMRLYVDGQLVGSNDVTTQQQYPGYWRVGGDPTWGGASSDYFAGRVDEVAVYGRALPASTVAEHFTAGGGATANREPVASFSASAQGLSVSVDGSGSSDPDGSVASYAWDFGDSSKGSGARTSHEYAVAGSYEVVLVVTDDRGATSRTSQTVQVTVPAPAPSTDIARDAFSRTAQGGLGSADVGGAWTTSGTASSFSVSGGTGRIQSERVGVNRSAALGGVSSSSTDLQSTLTLDTAPTGGGSYVSVLGRRVSASSDYRAKVRYQSDGRVVVYLTRVVNGSETTLTSAVVPGATATAGEQLRVRLQVSGSGTTELAVKAWKASSAEPSTWLSRTTDSTAALQAPGGLGFLLYVSGSGAPASLLVDDLVATPVTP